MSDTRQIFDGKFMVRRHEKFDSWKSIGLHAVAFVAFIGLTLALVLIFGARTMPEGWGLKPKDAMQVVILVITGIVITMYTIETFRLRRESARTRSAQTFHLVLNELNAVASERSATHELTANWKEWKEKEEVVNRLSVRLERIAYLCRARLVEPEHVKEFMALSFVDAWRLMHLWVNENLRQGPRSGVDPSRLLGPGLHRQHLEAFARECARYVELQHKRLGTIAEDDVRKIAACEY